MGLLLTDQIGSEPERLDRDCALLELIGNAYSLRSAFERPQGQADACHYRIPGALLVLWIPKVEAMNCGTRNGCEITAAIENYPVLL